MNGLCAQVLPLVGQQSSNTFDALFALVWFGVGIYVIYVLPVRLIVRWWRRNTRSDGADAAEDDG